MIEKLNHYPVHWIDGMKINKTHFQAIQDHVSDLSRDNAALYANDINFGLLPSNDSLRLEIVVDNQRLMKVKIENCEAITPNGSRISINFEDGGELDHSETYQTDDFDIKSVEEESVMICLSVNHFKREPFGNADPNETPPRLPFTKPEYKVHIMPESDWGNFITKSGYYLTLGKVILNSEDTALDKTYIPPSATVRSHPELVRFHTEIDRFFGQIEIYAVQILQKIYNKNQTNLLASLVKVMTNETIFYLGQEINKTRVIGLNSAPANMLMSVVGLCRVVKNYINSYAGSGKEELLNYFAQWCDLTQSEFDTIFKETTNIKYNHHDIGDSLQVVFQFMETYENLLSALNNLDYIGKMKDGSIFVSEQDNRKENASQPKRSRTFLAD